jgi:hypothetical protein
VVVGSPRAWYSGTGGRHDAKTANELVEERGRLWYLEVRLMSRMGGIDQALASAFMDVNPRCTKEDRSMRKTTAILAVAGLGLASLVVGMTAVAAPESTTGKVTIESKSVAIGVGVSWGDGTLVYKGKKYPFTVQGLSVVDLGVSKVSAKGDVMNLKKAEDFAGTYTAAGAGGTVGGGMAVAALKNHNGVEMKLTATTAGVKFALAGAGVTVKLK